MSAFRVKTLAAALLVKSSFRKAAMRSSSWVLGLALAGVLAPGFAARRAEAATTTYDTNNTPYTGGTIAPGDTVLLNDGAAVTGNVVADGRLQFNQTNGTLTISNTISGSGTLVLSNAGTLNLTGTTTATNTVVLDMTTSGSAGLLQIRSGNGSFVVGHTGSGTLNVAGGKVANADATLGLRPGSVGVATVSDGTWASTSSLTVGGTGTGTLSVSGGSVTAATTYVAYAGSIGTVTVSGGTVATTGRLDVGFGVSGTGAGTLNVTGGMVSGSASRLGGNSSGFGTVNVSSGTWVTTRGLTVGASGTGRINVSGGLVTGSDALVGGDTGSNGTVTVTGGTWATTTNIFIGRNAGSTGTLNVSGGSVTSASGTLGHNPNSFGTATVSSGTWAITNNLTVGSSGTGTLTMTGGRLIVGGTLSRGSLGTINLDSGGTLQIGASGTTGGLGPASFSNNGTLIFNRSDAYSYSGVLSGSGAVVNQGPGTLSLAGANAYTGLTTIAAGTLALSGSGSIGTGGLTLGTGAIPGTFDLTALTAGTYSLPASGNLAGVGVLSGAGKSLAVLGSFLSGHSPGTVSLGTGFTLDLASSGTSVFDIASPLYTAGTFDLVDGFGSVVFGGVLDLDFTNGPYANGTDVLTIFAATGGFSGDFTSVVASGLGAGQYATFNAATGTISVVPEPSTYAMAMAGIACGGFSMWRRKRACVRRR